MSGIDGCVCMCLWVCTQCNCLYVRDKTGNTQRSPMNFLIKAQSSRWIWSLTSSLSSQEWLSFPFFFFFFSQLLHLNNAGFHLGGCAFLTFLLSYSPQPNFTSVCLHSEVKGWVMAAAAQSKTTQNTSLAQEGEHFRWKHLVFLLQSKQRHFLNGVNWSKRAKCPTLTTASFIFLFSLHLTDSSSFHAQGNRLFYGCLITCSLHSFKYLFTANLL